jgi:hypothetical protein
MGCVVFSAQSEYTAIYELHPADQLFAGIGAGRMQ